MIEARWLAVGSALFFAGEGLLFCQTNSERLGEIESADVNSRIMPARIQPQREFPAVPRTYLYDGDRLLVATNGKVTFSLRDRMRVTTHGPAVVDIKEDLSKRSKVGLNVVRGLLYFFHLGQPTDTTVGTKTAVLAGPGTEFVLRVQDDGTTEVALLDGQVRLSSREFPEPEGTLLLTAKTSVIERAIAQPGIRPYRTASIDATSAIQWFLYYPAVLDADELSLGPSDRSALAESLAAYRSGNLLDALAKYPTNREPQSAAEYLYKAELVLSVGQISNAELLLAEAVRLSGADAERIARLTGAIQQLIAAVKNQQWRREGEPQLASEWLAESYYRQAQPLRTNLDSALVAARAAVTNSPEFGFAWVRLAELEFSFGRSKQAFETLKQGLELNGNNAQAYTLNGFLLAAGGHFQEAIQNFNKALAIDGWLGNAWLGRGLCKIRLGDLEDGLADLETAAAMEPGRSLLRSYLGKGFTDAGKMELAQRELNLAKKLDEKDPTPWLYSALLNQEQHRFNQGIGDLERSLELNDNRWVYRSRMLLDQDRAVRSTSLASIYRDNGMPGVSLREAALAVSHDYANYSAHLFLANSYDALRDPTRFNLRYETAWFNELLLANLLAPVGAGVFAQNISQQEYSRLLDVKRFGLTTTTDVRSDGQYREIASQFGNLNNFSYSLDLDYQHNNDIGDRGRPNNGLDRIEWYSQAKFQLAPADTLFLLTKYEDYHSGDNFQYYDWRGSVRTNFTFDEYQDPIIIGGYHHEWSPGAHTLLLAGHLLNDQHFSDIDTPLYVRKVLNGQVTDLQSPLFDVKYRSQLNAWPIELAQVVQTKRQTLVVGGRAQFGEVTTQNEITPKGDTAQLLDPIESNEREDFQRYTAYGYYTLQPEDDLFLTAGLSYDHVEFPKNFRDPPISSGQESKDLLGPKAAIVYLPLDWLVVRAAYAKSLGGLSLDQSYRLEPAELAGFVQTFRALIPEALEGSISAPPFETLGGAVDFKFRTGTYLSVEAQRLKSDVSRNGGVVQFSPGSTTPSTLYETLKFEETSVRISLNQLVGNRWSFGALGEFASAELQSDIPELRTFTPTIYTARKPRINEQSDLESLRAFALFNSPSGFFTGLETGWYWQQNDRQESMGSPGAPVFHSNLPSSYFPQVNVFFGYRLPKQYGEITFSCLNITAEDYHLNPLNIYSELPHDRVFAMRLRLRF